VAAPPPHVLPSAGEKAEAAEVAEGAVHSPLLPPPPPEAQKENVTEVTVGPSGAPVRANGNATRKGKRRKKAAKK